MLKLVEAVNARGGSVTIVFGPGDYHWLGEPLENKGASPDNGDDTFKSHATFKNLDSGPIAKQSAAGPRDGGDAVPGAARFVPPGVQHETMLCPLEPCPVDQVGRLNEQDWNF